MADRLRMFHRKDWANDLVFYDQLAQEHIVWTIAEDMSDAEYCCLTFLGGHGRIYIQTIF